ncbi:hypothetical protein D3C71_1371230 [compost metagenome]
MPIDTLRAPGQFQDEVGKKHAAQSEQKIGKDRHILCGYDLAAPHRKTERELLIHVPHIHHTGINQEQDGRHSHEQTHTEQIIAHRRVRQEHQVRRYEEQIVDRQQDVLADQGYDVAHALFPPLEVKYIMSSRVGVSSRASS